MGINSYKNNIYIAYQKYLNIKQKYGFDTHILVFPHTGTGDIWMIGRFLTHFLKKNKIKKYILLVKGTSESSIASLLNIKPTVIVSEDDINDLMKLSMYFPIQDNDIHILHHYVPIPQLCVTANFEGYKNVTFEDLFKIYTFGLDKRTKPLPFLINKINKKNNKILLNPYTNSIKNLPRVIWEKIAAYLIYCGFDVYTNTNDNNKIISGTKKLFLSHKNLINFANECYMFISIRSGICDIVADCDCIKIILTPDCWDLKWKNGPHKTIKYFGIENNYHSGKIHEIEFSRNNVDALYEKIKNILYSYIHKKINIYTDINNLTPVNKLQKKCLIMTFDKCFFKFAFVTISSIIKNSSKDTFYDLILFASDIEIDDLLVLKNYIEKCKNFSVRFVDLKILLTRYKYKITKYNYPPIVYTRLFLPDILSKYDKALYIDSDMLVRTDLNILLNLDIKDSTIAVVPDVGFAAWRHARNNPEGKYLSYNLCFSNKQIYCNTGLILINIKKYNDKCPLNYLIELVESKINWHFCDQDILNYLFMDSVYYLDLKWNFIEFASYVDIKKDKKLLSSYKKAKNDPYITHFIGKGYLVLNNPHAIEYFKYAQSIPYYEEICKERLSISTSKKLIIRIINKLKKSYLLNKIFPQGSNLRKRIKKYYIAIIKHFEQKSKII